MGEASEGPPQLEWMNPCPLSVAAQLWPPYPPWRLMGAPDWPGCCQVVFQASHWEKDLCEAGKPWYSLEGTAIQPKNDFSLGKHETCMEALCSFGLDTTLTSFQSW